MKKMDADTQYKKLEIKECRKTASLQARSRPVYQSRYARFVYMLTWCPLAYSPPPPSKGV